MASIERRGSRWRARVHVQGQRESMTFATRREAAAWSLQREAELAGKQLPRCSFGAALTRYAAEVAPTHRGERWERIRLAKIERDVDLSARPLASLTSGVLAQWRDRRLAQVSPATVAREMNLLRAVLEHARREWGWLAINPLQDVRRPRSANARSQRVSDEDVTAIGFALGWDGVAAPANASQRVALMFAVAVETAMRSGEMVSLEWPQVHLAERYVHLERTKNGDERDVPLSRRAIELIGLLPKDGPLVFGVSGPLRDALFRQGRDAAGLRAIHFHDARHEATTRLARKLDVLDLSRMTGHRDLKSLRRYYNPTASELAARLDD